MEELSPAIGLLMAAIGGCIRDATAAHLNETAAFLRMAQIDLITRVHGISEEELEVFLFALESEQRIADHITPPELMARKAASLVGDGQT